MSDFAELQNLTEEFFELHWPSEFPAAPQWVTPFTAARPGPYPNHDHSGCYALFGNDRLCYIGVAVSKGKGRYAGQSIGKRIQHVVQVDWDNRDEDGRRIYKVKDKWPSVTHLSTIGIPERGYLAPALEQYLLERLNPDSLLNTQGVNRA